jgi:hypothetical protein
VVQLDPPAVDRVALPPERVGHVLRGTEAHQFQYRDVQVPWLVAEALYDLQSGRYLVGSLTNEEGSGFDFSQRFSHSDFTPQAVRRMGKR